MCNLSNNLNCSSIKHRQIPKNIAPAIKQPPIVVVLLGANMPAKNANETKQKKI
jgi:hypothetical protein